MKKKINSRMCRTLAIIYMANYLVVHDQELRSKVDPRLQLVLDNTLRVAKRKHGEKEILKCASLINKANHDALQEIDFEYKEDTHQVFSLLLMSIGDAITKMLAMEFVPLLEGGSIVDTSTMKVKLFFNVYSRLSDSLNLPLDVSSRVIYRKAKKEPKIKQKRARERGKKKEKIVKKKLPRKVKIRQQIEKLEIKIVNCPEWAKQAYRRKIKTLKDKL
jgi:hypothetical protein